MRRTMKVLLALILVLALAGCAADVEAPTTTTTIVTPPAETTTTRTTTTTTPIVTLPEEGPTNVSMLLATPRGTAGSDALICWRVAGTGTSPHVALHHDDESHSGANVTFAAYDGGTTYPRNESSPASAGYVLPSNFCATLPVPATGRLYYRAHAMGASGEPGVLSEEATLEREGTATSIALTSFPSSAPANSTATVCWRVEGSGNVGHVAVHHDNESHAGSSARYSDYDAGAAYPDNESILLERGYDLPATFCTGVPIPTTGAVYLRAHVLDASGEPGRVSEEAEIRKQA